MERRQGYAGVTGSISSASEGVEQVASQATSSLTRGEIVAIVVCILVILVLLIGTTWYCCVKTARRRVAAREEEEIKAKQRIIGDPSSTSRVEMMQQHNTMADHNLYSTSKTGSDEDWSRQPLRVAEDETNIESHGSRYF